MFLRDQRFVLAKSQMRFCFLFFFFFERWELSGDLKAKNRRKIDVPGEILNRW